MTDHEDIRPPIDLAGVASQRWRVEVVEETTSTNADVAERFRSGEQEGLVLVAEHQTAGRGRLGREWVTPPRTSLTVSFLLVPGGTAAGDVEAGDVEAGDVEAGRWSWLPLLTGVAAAAAVHRVAGVEVELKWPNDVLVEGHKLGGILLERVEHVEQAQKGAAAAVVGIGINCTQLPDELPVPEATSLAIVTGGTVDRSALLAALVEELALRYDEWLAGADLREAYLALCRTPGQDVRVAVPGGEVVGEAVDVDASGRLVVRTEGGEEHLGAGDVVYVRPR